MQPDEDGNAIHVFIGKINGQTALKKIVRVAPQKKDKEGNIIKDHWERKAKAS